MKRRVRASGYRVCMFFSGMYEMRGRKKDCRRLSKERGSRDDEGRGPLHYIPFNRNRHTTTIVCSVLCRHLLRPSTKPSRLQSRFISPKSLENVFEALEIHQGRFPSSGKLTERLCRLYVRYLAFSCRRRYIHWVEGTARSATYPQSLTPWSPSTESRVGGQ